MRALAEEAGALRRAGRTEEALDAYRRLVSAEPEAAGGWHDLGALLQESGRPDEAERALRRSVALDPAAIASRHALAITLMTRGEYEEGWALYRVRHEMPGHYKPERPVGFPFPELRGGNVRGKHVVIFPEQGHGDQIQYARFAPELVRAGAAVTLLTRPSLQRLFADSFEGVRVLVASGAVEFPDPDSWVMSSDLPGVLGATPDSLPRPPYLSTNVRWPALPPGFKIGLMSRGNPLHPRDAARSLSNDDAARLARSLPGQIVDLAPEKSGAGDFAETAALIGGLDLIVSVDTAVAHLAGALGRRCLTLIPGHATDWRWMVGRSDSPWYPTMTLYRGDPGGDWTSAIARVCEDARRIAVAV